MPDSIELKQGLWLNPLLNDELNAARVPFDGGKPQKKQAHAKGDLHGNAVNFLHALMTKGVLEFDGIPTEADWNYLGMPVPADNTYYELFKQMYQKDLSHWNKDNLKPLLESFSSKIKVSDYNQFIDMGDDFFDRGKSDIFTMMLFSKVAEKPGALTAILSNQATALVYVMEKYKKLKEAGKSDDEALEAFHPKIDFQDGYPLILKDSPSGLSLYPLLKSGAIDINTLQDFYTKAFVPNIKLIHTVKVADQFGIEHIELFSHAPINEADILMAARCCTNDELGRVQEAILHAKGKKGEKLNNKELIDLIDLINKHVKYHAEHNTLSKFLETEIDQKMKQADGLYYGDYYPGGGKEDEYDTEAEMLVKELPDFNRPLQRLFWNRRDPKLNMQNKYQSKNSSLVTLQSECEFTVNHGRVTSYKNFIGCTNLGSDLGNHAELIHKDTFVMASFDLMIMDSSLTARVGNFDTKINMTADLLIKNSQQHDKLIEEILGHLIPDPAILAIKNKVIAFANNRPDLQSAILKVGPAYEALMSGATNASNHYKIAVNKLISEIDAEIRLQPSEGLVVKDKIVSTALPLVKKSTAVIDRMALLIRLKEISGMTHNSHNANLNAIVTHAMIFPPLGKAIEFAYECKTCDWETNEAALGAEISALTLLWSRLPINPETHFLNSNIASRIYILQNKRNAAVNNKDIVALRKDLEQALGFNPSIGVYAFWTLVAAYQRMQADHTPKNIHDFASEVYALYIGLYIPSSPFFSKFTPEEKTRMIPLLHQKLQELSKAQGIAEYLPGGNIHNHYSTVYAFASHPFRTVFGGGTSDHAYRVMALHNSAIALRAGTYNMLDKAKPLGPFMPGMANNPLGLMDESQYAYNARKMAQILTLVELLHNGGNSLDFLCLQEADWAFVVHPSEPYYNKEFEDNKEFVRLQMTNALGIMGYHMISVPPSGSQQGLVTIFNTNTLIPQPIAGQAYQGILPIGKKNRAVKMNFQHIQGKEICVINGHMAYGQDYSAEFKTELEKDKTRLTVWAGDANTNHSERMPLLVTRDSSPSVISAVTVDDPTDNNKKVYKRATAADPTECTLLDPSTQKPAAYDGFAVSAGPEKDLEVQISGQEIVKMMNGNYKFQLIASPGKIHKIGAGTFLNEKVELEVLEKRLVAAAPADKATIVAKMDALIAQRKAREGGTLGNKFTTDFRPNTLVNYSAIPPQPALPLVESTVANVHRQWRHTI